MKEEILKRMQTRIMEHQQEKGFETIFDFLNEDIEELQEQVKLFDTPVSKQRDLLIAYAKLENGGDKLYDIDIEKINMLLESDNFAYKTLYIDGIRNLLIAFSTHLNTYAGFEEVRFDFMAQDYIDKINS